MRGKIRKGIALILSAVLSAATLVTAIPQMSVPVYAAGTDKDLQLGAAVLSADCNSNSAATVYFDDSSDAWRVIGYGTDGVAAGSGKMTLLASGNMDHGAYDSSSPYSNNYKDSNLQSMTNTLSGRLTAIESGAVATKTLTGGSANQGAAEYNSNNISGDTVENAVMWPLSVAEANDVNSNLRQADPSNPGLASSYWWLRSPGFGDYSAAVVYGYGDVDILGDDVIGAGYGVRPAFNLNLSSIIFTSAAESGKNPTTAGTLEAPGDYTQTAWKLTLHDSKMVIAEGTAGVSRDDTTITVPYTITGDNAGSTNRVSVLITDKVYTAADAVIKYYGKLAITGDIGTSGTGTFTLPNDFDTDWKVYILSEVIRDDKKSDYASTPVEITIPDPAGASYSVTMQNDGHGTATATPTSGAAGASISITATPSDNYQFDHWEVVSGGVNLADASSQTTTFDIVDSDVTIKAHFEEIPASSYSVQVTTDGHGSATASPTSGTTGTSVTIKAKASSGYKFKEWQVISGDVTLADKDSSTTTFDIKNKNVSIKALFEKKSDPKPDPKHDDDDSDSGSSDSKPKEEKPYDYLDELRAKLKTAIDLGGYQTVTWDKGTALPYDIMKTLQDNPKITLIFSYTYENVNFKVTLPGQSVKAYTNIPWYGPLYLYAYYGGRGAVQNAPVLNSTNRTYTVVKGDTLTGIAIKLNTTVKSLVSLNNIKDPDKLKIGQVLKY